MKILSCNIRTSTADDGANNWEYRKDYCCEVIEAHSPDIVCFQEMKRDQFVHVQSYFRQFRSYAIPDVPAGQNPVNAIFYRSDRFRFITGGGYWLSETPHVAGSKSWDSKHVRLANWVRLQNCTEGYEFRVINTHLDNKGQIARKHQAEIINEDAAAYTKDYRQLLTGDMNCDSHSEAIDVFKGGGWVDTYGSFYHEENPGHTFHRFHGTAYRTEAGKGKIDWIFGRGALETRDAKIITDSVSGKYPSDHYFVSADVVGA